MNAALDAVRMEKGPHFLDGGTPEPHRERIGDDGSKAGIGRKPAIAAGVARSRLRPRNLAFLNRDLHCCPGALFCRAAHVLSDRPVQIRVQLGLSRGVRNLARCSDHPATGCLDAADDLPLHVEIAKEAVETLRDDDACLTALDRLDRVTQTGPIA